VFGLHPGSCTRVSRFFIASRRVHVRFARSASVSQVSGCWIHGSRRRRGRPTRASCRGSRAHAIPHIPGLHATSTTVRPSATERAIIEAASGETALLRPNISPSPSVVRRIVPRVVATGRSIRGEQATSGRRDKLPSRSRTSDLAAIHSGRALPHPRLRQGATATNAAAATVEVRLGQRVRSPTEKTGPPPQASIGTTAEKVNARILGARMKGCKSEASSEDRTPDAGSPM
jgi:hypothetical protein